MLLPGGLGRGVPVARLLACLLTLACCTHVAWGQAPGVATESAVKAAFLSKFGGFVEWPAATAGRSSEPLQIGVIGNDAVAADLEQIIQAQPAGNRVASLRRLGNDDGTAGLQVLFIGAGRKAKARELAAAASGAVLIVTEQDDGLQQGGVLNFIVEGGRVRFTASVPAAEARGLRLSARLLAVAHTVEGRVR